METTIHFANDLKQTKSNTDHADDIGIGGVYSIRKRPSSLHRRTSIEAPNEKVFAEDEDPGLRDENDYKRKQVKLLLSP
jgi:hypothetical protein